MSLPLLRPAKPHSQPGWHRPRPFQVVYSDQLVPKWNHQVLPHVWSEVERCPFLFIAHSQAKIEPGVPDITKLVDLVNEDQY
jgi:hypothetical protein